MASPGNEIFSTATTLYQSNNTGMDVAIPKWLEILTIITQLTIILLSVLGNLFIIISVFTYKPLRVSQNLLLVSLGASDLALGLFVMPFSAVYINSGEWHFGYTACKIWLTCDIVCCTASIHNLCAIAYDRYKAVTDPINYAQQRTLNRVVRMIFAAWALSVVIATPPLFGWNDWPSEEQFNKNLICPINLQKSYVIFSSLGSFYSPAGIFLKGIYQAIVAILQREREKASRMNMQARQNEAPNQQPAAVDPKEHVHPPPDQGSVGSETNHNENPQVQEVSKKLKRKGAKDKIKYLAPKLAEDESINENNQSASCSKQYLSPNQNTTRTSSTESPGSSTIDATPEQVDMPVAAAVAAAAAEKPAAVYRFFKEKLLTSPSKEKKAAWLLVLVACVFIFCWTPFFIYYLFAAFCDNFNISPRVVNIIIWLGYLNSALNSIMYTVFNSTFRCVFKKVIKYVFLKPLSWF